MLVVFSFARFANRDDVGICKRGNADVPNFTFENARPEAPELKKVEKATTVETTMVEKDGQLTYRRQHDDPGGRGAFTNFRSSMESVGKAAGDSICRMDTQSTTYARA